MSSMDYLTTKLRLAIPTNALNLPIGGTTTLSDGTPVRRFMRYLLQVGQKYIRKGWDKALDVTEERAAHWLSMWQEMKADGKGVKITMDHRDYERAANIMGDQVDMVRQGDWLCSIHDVRGKENIRIAEANKDVSVEIYPSVPAGNGKVYKDAIAAITYTSIPVVHSQPIAASMADDVQILFLSNGDNSMMDSGLMCSIASLAGVKPEEVNEANAKQHVDNHIAECKSMKASLATATAELTASKAQVLKLSNAAPEVPSKRELSLIDKLATSKFDRLVETGAASKATADGFKALLVGTIEVPSAMMLSLHGGDEIESTVEKVCKLIAENKPVVGAEGTKGQHFALPRITPDADAAKEPAGYGWGKVDPRANTPAAKQA